jgi:hypothetical protein
MVNRQTVINTFERIFHEDFVHGNGMYRDHCIGVYDILIENKVSEDICLAGLWHSTFGTENYKPPSLIPVPVVIGAIGETATELVVQFCNLKNRTTSLIHNKELPNRQELLWIEYANLLEQWRRSPNTQLENIMEAVKNEINDDNKFSSLGYQPVKQILSSEICDLVTQYTLIEELNANHFGSRNEDSQVPGSHATYSDSLMESLLLKLQPAMEYVTGKKLMPTYSYYRVYRGGADLKKHTDRPSCEYSCTVFFGKNYLMNPEGEWAIYMDGNPVVLDVGDAVVYKGMEKEHWRDPWDESEYSTHVQGFFHYVDINGEHKDHALDKRKFIGQKKDNTQNLPSKPYVTYL